MVTTFISAGFVVLIFGAIIAVIRYLNKKSESEDVKFKTNKINSIIDVSDPQKLLVELNNFIEIYPENAVAYYQRGIIYMKLKQYDYAIVNFSRCLYYKPEEDIKNLCKLYRGKANYYLTNYKEALEDFNNAVDTGVNISTHAICTKCGTENILDKEEIQQLVFTCGECGSVNSVETPPYLLDRMEDLIICSRKNLNMGC